MSLDLNTVMDALGDALEGIAGLRVYGYPPESVAVPAAVVGYPDGALEYDTTYRGATDTATFAVHVVVGKVSDRASRDAIGAYVARSGPSSVKAALEADPTLGGAVGSLRVQRASFLTMTAGGVDYLAASFDVEVIA